MITLRRRGLVGRIPPKDQWDHASWFLTDEGKMQLKREQGMI